jgi:hypothetical protein
MGVTNHGHGVLLTSKQVPGGVDNEALNLRRDSGGNIGDYPEELSGCKKG